MRNFLVFISLILFSSLAFSAQQSDEEITKILIQQSIANHSGTCPCPYSLDKINHTCGDNSAWSKSNGKEPLCFEKDVTPEMILEYRKQMSSERSNHSSTKKTSPRNKDCDNGGRIY